MNKLLIFFSLLLCLKTSAQPDIKHSIYFKDKYCPKPLGNGFINYMQHSKGGIYATRSGYIYPNPGYTAVFQKVNSNFDTLFTVNYNAVDYIKTNKILELPNGNILLVGSTSRNDGGVLFNDKPGTFTWMLEVDTFGHVIKKNTFGGGAGWLNDASITSDGYILMAGTSNANDHDLAHPFNGSAIFAWVAKYDTAFNKIWIKIYDNNGEDGDPTIKEVLPNRYMIGYASSGIDTGAVPAESRGMSDLVVYYTDSSANILWKHRYGTPGLDGSKCSAVDPVTKDIYFADQLYSAFGGDVTYASGTCWIHKVDTFGNIKGSKAYGAATDGTFVQDIKWYQNNLWLLAFSQGGGGDMDSNMFTGIPATENAWIAILDSHVNLTGKFTFQTLHSDQLTYLFEYNNNLYASGVVASYVNPYKCDTANMTQMVLNLGLAPLGVEDKSKQDLRLFTIYPNPTSNTLYIKIEENYIQEKGELRVTDIEGRTVFRKTITHLPATEQVDCSSWQRGNYIVEMRINEKKQTKKFTKQ